jgi:Fungal protein kinase
MDDVVGLTVRDMTIDTVERPSTPPNRTSQLPNLSGSTPFSNTPSSYASSDRSQLKLKPFLDDDIKDPPIISFEAFLQDVFEFNTSTNINLEEICENDETRRLLEAFLLTLDRSELQRYEPFINLANHMFSLLANKNGRECSIFARRHDRRCLENSSRARRLPDVVFASKLEDLQRNSLHWSDVKLVLEFKVKSPRSNVPSIPSGIYLAPSSASTGSKRRPGVSAGDNAPNKSPRNETFKNDQDTLQLASYALESFSHGPYRSHVVHGMIRGSTLELWYYDRVGAVRSEAVDFSKSLVLLAQFLMAIAHLSETGWGIHPRIIYPRLTPLSRSLSLHPNSPTPNSTDDKSPSLDIESHGSVHASSDPSTPESPLNHDEPFRGATITIQGREFVLGVCLSRHYALTGRGTCVIDADGGLFVVKLSWPEKSRTPEYEFLERAYTSAKE